MSGHNKWSSIKHKKSAADAKRGKIFSKIIKEITVAARLGGADVTGNPRLRTAINLARTENMPKDNVERAIKKGTGELEGVSYEEFTYEGYGPGGTAIFIESLTDNKNRAVADIRHVFTKYGGNLGENGCVAWMFEKKGLIVIPKGTIEEDQLMEIALEAGAEDVRDEDKTFDVITEPDDFEAVKQAIDKANITIELAEVTRLPKNTVPLNKKEAEQLIKIMDKLEDCDDVQKIYTNGDIPDDIMSDID